MFAQKFTSPSWTSSAFPSAVTSAGDGYAHLEQWNAANNHSGVNHQSWGRYLSGTTEDIAVSSRAEWSDRRLELREVPVFALDHGKAGKKQMTLVFFKWLLHEGRQAHDNDIQFVLRQESEFSGAEIRRAFQTIRESKPKLALWLVPHSSGDVKETLAVLKEGLDGTRKIGVRHGIFHWPYELCDQFGLTPEVFARAYEAADFVFQFGYQDERLSRINKSKYLPFPLGTALKRGWLTPSKVVPTSRRPLLAAYRGTSSNERSRRDLVKAVKGIRRVALEVRQSWSSLDSTQDRNRYRTLLRDAQYALAPWGHNPNSYRVMEAVESGAIPVIVIPASGCYENWAAVYGLPAPGCIKWEWIPEAPFKVLDSWNSFHDRVREFKKNATDLSGDALRRWYHEWHMAFYDQLQLQVLNCWS